MARLLKRAGLVLGALGLLLALSVGAVFLYAGTDAAGEQARRFIVEALNDSVAGRLEAAKFRLTDGAFVFEGVRLHTPEGELVADIERVEARASLWDLVRGKFDIEEVKVHAPKVFLRLEEHGLNLGRALAAKKPSTSPSAPLRIAFDALTVTSGAVHFAWGQGPEESAHAEALTLEGAGHVVTEPLAIEAHARLVAAVRALDKAAFQSEVDVTFASGDLKLSLSAQRPEAKLAAHMTLGLFGAGSRISVEGFEASAPGVSATGSGLMNGQQVSAKARLDAKDLTAAQNYLKDAWGLVAPKLAGAGTLDAAVGGTLAQPSVSAQGDFPLLRVADAAMHGAQVKLEWKNVRKAFEVDGVVGLSRLQVGGEELRDVEARVRTSGSNTVADVSVQGLAQAKLHLEGKFDKSGTSFRASAATVDWEGSAWALESPTSLHWSDDFIALRPAAFRFGNQRIAVEIQESAKTLTGKARVEGLSLGALPLPWVRAYGLSGILNGEVDVDGPRQKPNATFAVHLRDGGAKGFKAVDADLSGRVKRGVVDASVTASSPAGKVTAHGQGTLASFAATATVQDADVRVFAQSVGMSSPIDARVSAQGTVSGSLKGITFAVNAESFEPSFDMPSDAGAGFTVAFDRVQWMAAGSPDSGVQLSADVVWKESITHAEVRSDWALEKWRSSSADGGWKNAPFVGSAKARALPLGSLHDALGTTDVDVSGQGLLGTPEGTARVSVAGMTVSPLAPFDAQLDVTADKTKTRLELKTSHAGAGVLEAQVDWAAPLLALTQDTRGKVGLTGRVATTGVQTKGLLAASESEGVTRADATLGLSGTVSGTLDEPLVDLKGALEPITWNGKRVAGLAFAATVTGDGATAVADLTTGAKGRLHFDGKWGAGLMRREWKSAPLSVEFDATQVDVAAFTGLVPGVRSLAGTLNASLKVVGSLDEPSARGYVDWKKGALSIPGLGEFHDIALAASGDQDRIELQGLDAHAGAGTLHAQGQAHRTTGSWVHEGTLDAVLWPVVFDDQLRAIASLQSSWSGQATAENVEVRPLRLRKVRVELPEVKRKDLQSLDRPRDIHVRRKLASPLRPKVDEKPVTWTLLVDAPDDVLITSSDVDLEVGFSPEFRVEFTDKLSLYGEVAVVKHTDTSFAHAHVDVIGRRFEVQRDAKVGFSGPATSPHLNVGATYTNEREGVTVTVSVSGKGNDFSLRMTSNPTLSDTEIYTLLATGRRSLKRGSDAALTGEEAASVVGALAAAKLKTAISKKVPLDVLTIESGARGIQEARIQFGKYFSDRVYVGGQANLGADPRRENRWEARAEFQLSRRWTLEAFFGDSLVGGTDVVWTRDY